MSESKIYDYERLEDIELSLLDAGPYSVRKHDERKLQSLASSIKQRQGVMDAIAVAPKGDGGNRYWIIYGNRRAKAARIAGQEKIRSKVYPSSLPEDERWIMSCTENKEREDVTIEEMADIIAKIVERCDHDKGKAAHRLGCTVREIDEWLSARIVVPYAPSAKEKDIETLALIKKLFNKPLWTEVWNKVKHLEREEAKKAVRTIAKGADPDEVVTKIMEKRDEPKGTMIQCHIEDGLLARAIGAAAELDGLTKPHFMIQAAKKEVTRRGLYQMLSPQQTQS
jgi:ParB/RepB/Spo0J family partition protein